MARLVQVVVDGIANGSVYAALALALVLIYRSTGVVNFAQGEMAMFSTFLTWGMTEAGVALPLAILAALALSFGGGALLERIVIRPFEVRQPLTLVIVAVLLVDVGLLFRLFQRNRLGLAMRAATIDPVSSRLVGIRVGHMLMI